MILDYENSSEDEVIKVKGKVKTLHERFMFGQISKGRGFELHEKVVKPLL